MKNKMILLVLLVGILSVLVATKAILNVGKSTSVSAISTSTKNQSTSTTTTTKVVRERTVEAAKENEKVYDIDDNNLISWGNLCFSIENKQLFVYLNSYNNKYKTLVKDADYMYFIYNQSTKEGTIVVVCEEDIKRYTFKDTDVYTSENLKELIGTCGRITQ